MAYATRTIKQDHDLLSTGYLRGGYGVSVTDPHLLNAIDNSAAGAAASSFIIAVQSGGIELVPGTINAVILTTAWGAGNSF